jgi:phosphopantothenoylcysteine synthetase/decarboxylase
LAEFRDQLIVVACAAPPTSQLSEFVSLLHRDGWEVHIVGTPAARSWLDVTGLTEQTGHRVAIDARRPDEPKSLPRAAAIVVAPATFNTINKWAAGINDSLALGMLNESLGGGLPVVASPYAKAVLTAHPAYPRSLELLRDAGVTFTATDALRPAGPDAPFQWAVVHDVLRRETRER